MNSHSNPSSARVEPGQVEAPDFAFSPRPSCPGKAAWVWLNEPQARPAAALFRKEIELKQAPVRADAWISADAAYRLYINGVRVDRGPDDIGKDYDHVSTGKWMLNDLNLALWLKAGRNVIAVEVFRAEALRASLTTTGQGGLWFEARLDFGDGTARELVADGSWRGIKAPQWRFDEWLATSRERIQKELCFDAAQEPVGWREPGFDDAAWPACAARDDLWSPMVVSEIPRRFEADYPMREIVRPSGGAVIPEEPSSQPVVFNADGGFAVRFDRVIAGFVRIRAVAAHSGAVLEIQSFELDRPGFQRMMIVRLRAGEQEIETPYYDSFTVLNIQARHVTAPVSVNVTARFVSYPVRYKGSFECSDPALNRIWEVTRWVTQLCLQTHHLDSPHHQEPVSDPGDYLIEALSTYYAFGEPWLARQDLRKYGWIFQRQGFTPFHTSYALLWLQMLVQYGDYTGDTALWKELAPAVHGLLETFTGFRGPNGLLTNAPNYMFMDWVKIGAFDGHHPPAVIGQGYLTAFYYRALADGIRIAGFLDDAQKVERYTRLREEVKRAYNAALWDEKAGLYRDGIPFLSGVPSSGWLPPDVEIETHTAQNNTLAVAYDLAPAEAQAALMRRVLSGPDFNCQPYFMHFVFDALLHCGLYDAEALPQLRRWQINPETQSFSEMWTTGDYSHAWQTPLYQLSARVLGVTPLEPGFAKISVTPHMGDLHWARGEVPTPRGPVRVSWKNQDGRCLLDVSAPEGVEVVTASK